MPSPDVLMQLLERIRELERKVARLQALPEAAAGGSSTFLGLTDTPSNYTADANKYLRVNAGESAVVFDYIDYATDINGIPTTFAPIAHASMHKHGGADEVGTATPTANAIPKAGAGGTLDVGWLTGVIKADGTVALTGDWDAGASRAIKVQEIQARSNLGLRIEDDGGNLGLFIEDSTGDIGLGTDTPGVSGMDVSRSGVAQVRLTSSSDTSTSGATFAARTNGADVELVFSAHDTLRTETRFGQTIGGFAELLMRGSGILGALIGLTTNDPIIIGTNDTERMRIEGGGNIAIGGTVANGKLGVEQPSTTAAIPTIYLTQADLSEEFIEFNGTVSAGNPINTTALGAYYGRVRVSVNGTAKWLALYD